MRIPDLSSIPELVAVAEGEYDLRIIGAYDYNGANSHGIRLNIEIVGEDNADNFSHFLSFPLETDDEKTAANKWRRIKKFLTDIDLPTDQEIENDMFEDIEFSGFLNYDEEKWDGTPLEKPQNSLRRVT